MVTSLEYDSKPDFLWPAFSRMKHPLYTSTSKVFVRGKGTQLFDESGKGYYDGFSTLWTNLVGHGREEIIAAMTEQMHKLSFMHLFTGSTHQPAHELSEILIESSPFKHKHCVFGLSGSDATETAIKLARAYWWGQGRPQKNIIVGRLSEYHGTSLGALSLMGQDDYQIPYSPLVSRTHRVPPPNCYRCPWKLDFRTCNVECKNAFDEYFENINAKENVAAILIEPIITSDGLIPPPKGYWEHIQKVCRENEVLIVADEVSTGMGRTGTLYGSTQFGLQPDICYLAKSLTSGYAPLSVVTTSKEIFDVLNSNGKYFSHGTTFGGHPTSCIAAIKTFEILFKENLVEASSRLGKALDETLTHELEGLEHVGSIRGAGTLFEIELVQNKNTKLPPRRETELGMLLYRDLLDQGQYVRVLGRFLCIAPPLVSTVDEVIQMAKAIRCSIERLTTNRSLWFG
ncbi:MAG: aminotransferase class III-fold pyridoxal phosphate-dependent enzyme [Acidobacteriota bacterium]